MLPFQKATVLQESIERTRRALLDAGHDAKEVEAVIADEAKCDLYKNDEHQVAVRPWPMPDGWPSIVHLSIKRLDREPIHDWRILQEIKNEIVGPECEAVELYPAESRKVDVANQYHLFAIAEPFVRFPFGFTSRAVDGQSNGPWRQRPL